MLPRNRLKKEPANLLKSKNRILLIGIFIVGIIGFMIYMPGDILSPGYSIVNEEGMKTDNEWNVMHYPYTIKSTKTQMLLKDQKFSFLDFLDIPGMPETKNSDYENRYIFSTEQYPQGLCITEDYYLITSYSGGEENLGELMVFDKYTGEYLLTLGMDEKSHLGGIAYDGENIWVCNSYYNALERISYNAIGFWVTFGKGKVIDITNLVDVYPIDCPPSCIAYYDGSLWIATHNIWMNSNMWEYHYDRERDTLTAQSTCQIPSQVQGVTFTEEGEVYLSISYGRRNSSYIKKYSSVKSMNENPEDYELLIELPPCSEELMYDKGNLYILFESAGEKYLEGTDGLGKSICPIDKILVIDLTWP